VHALWNEVLQSVAATVCVGVCPLRTSLTRAVNTFIFFLCTLRVLLLHTRKHSWSGGPSGAQYTGDTRVFGVDVYTKRFQSTIPRRKCDVEGCDNPNSTNVPSSNVFCDCSTWARVIPAHSSAWRIQWIFYNDIIVIAGPLEVSSWNFFQGGPSSHQGAPCTVEEPQQHDDTRRMACEPGPYPHTPCTLHQVFGQCCSGAAVPPVRLPSPPVPAFKKSGFP